MTRGGVSEETRTYCRKKGSCTRFGYKLWGQGNRTPPAQFLLSHTRGFPTPFQSRVMMLLVQVFVHSHSLFWEQTFPRQI